MNDAARSCRGNDIKSLIDRGLAYLALDLPREKLRPAIAPGKPKEGTRGHNHIVLSRLLCPVRLLEEFDKNPDEYAFVRPSFHVSPLSRFRKKILRGDIKFNDEDFPSMLYPQPDGYDPDDVEANLLQNQTAVHVSTLPFQSQ